MSAVARQKITVAEYLAMERASEEKHEFLAGEIYLMSGATSDHNLVAGNTYASLHAQLRKRPCLVYPSDMRVEVKNTGLYTYPDIIVVCDPPRFKDDHHDTLLNPTLIIEVLSPSTESYDRGKKFQHYRTLASLQEYVLISQESSRVERYLRQPNDEWLLADASGIGSSIELASIQCTLSLAEVYEKVTFDAE